jgi:hypothetical protein
MGNDDGSRRGAARRLGGPAGPLAACAAAGLLAAACASGGSLPADVPAVPAGQAAATQAVTAAAPRAIAYDLYTHCGVDEAKIGTRFYEAVTPLSDGNGNPPAGWGNPSQPGTMTVVSATQAVFTDKAGHRVVFAVRPGATAFRQLCS